MRETVEPYIINATTFEKILQMQPSGGQDEEESENDEDISESSATDGEENEKNNDDGASIWESDEDSKI